MRLITGTANEAHRAFTFSTKEPETLDWIDGFLPGSAGGDIVFFDVGANVGIYSLYAGIRHESIRVYSFEPEAQSFASLCRNIYINEIRAITPFQIALSKSNGLGTMFISSLDAGAGAAALGEKYRLVKTDPKVLLYQGVTCCTIDHLVSEHGLPSPTHIKIDVDGIESDIIYSSRRVLSDPKLSGLLVEFQYERVEELGSVIEFLHSCGMELEKRSSWIGRAGALNSQNFIFRRALRDI